MEVWQVGCPEFVPLIEQDRSRDPYTAKIARQYLQPLLEHQIDTLIYGCTHYRFLETTLGEILSPTVQLVDPAEYVVRAVEKELELMGLKNSLLASQTRFCVSGCPKRFAQLSQRWLGYYPAVEKIRLPVRANLGKSKI